MKQEIAHEEFVSKFQKITPEELKENDDLKLLAKIINSSYKDESKLENDDENENDHEDENDQEGETEMETKLQMDNPRITEEKSFMKNQHIDKPTSLLQEEAKTKVKITINVDNVYIFKLHKPPNSLTLGDVRNHLFSMPKKFGIMDNKLYEFNVKTQMNGKVVLEEIDEDDYVLPLIRDSIELECWSI